MRIPHGLSLALALVLLTTASAALAHHSFAVFDRTKKVTLTGTVKDFQWTNPHAWIQVDVPDEKGQSTEWGVECGSPNMMARTGWKKTTLKARRPHHGGREPAARRPHERFARHGHARGRHGARPRRRTAAETARRAVARVKAARRRVQSTLPRYLSYQASTSRTRSSRRRRTSCGVSNTMWRLSAAGAPSISNSGFCEVSSGNVQS